MKTPIISNECELFFSKFIQNGELNNYAPNDFNGGMSTMQLILTLRILTQFSCVLDDLLWPLHIRRRDQVRHSA